MSVKTKKQITNMTWSELIEHNTNLVSEGLKRENLPSNIAVVMGNTQAWERFQTTKTINTSNRKSRTKSNWWLPPGVKP